MPSLGWYFLVALFFLLVVILSVPGDGRMLPEDYRLENVSIRLR